MNRENEKQFESILKNTNSDVLSTLRSIITTLLDDQKSKEAARYERLLTTPSEAAAIVKNAGGCSAEMARFAVDALRYYLASDPVYRMGGGLRPIWAAGFLMEAGRIIGIRQERARRKAHETSNDGETV